MQTGSTIVLKPHTSERRLAAVPTDVGGPGMRALEPGTHLDRYLILERLGGGATGQVYRARDTELDREVALKILARPHRRQSDMLSRVRAEAQSQARLRSPHVVTLYSLLELPFAAVLVLEFVDGETLEKRIRTTGPLSSEDATAVFEQALLGLAHVHEMGVIHRDLKPGNLLLANTGLVKIMDFSVARLATHDTFPPRTMVGTLLYSAPEQISGRGTDERSDIYAIGMSLYEAVTGRLPFERHSEYALMHAHAQEQPPRPRDLAPALSAAFERVILKAIEKEPERRYRDALEFRAALIKFSSPSNRHTVTLPANAYGPAPPPRTRRHSVRRMFAGFALDFALIFAVCAMLYTLVIPPKQGPTKPAPRASHPAAAIVPAKHLPRSTSRPVRMDPTPPPPPRARPKINRANDPYKALRRAWGD